MKLRSLVPFGKRANSPLSFNEYVNLLTNFGYNGVQYTLPGERQEEIVHGQFVSHTRAAFKTNGVIFACVSARMRLFSEARFQFRARNNGRPGSLFGTAALGPLEQPWPGATTGALLSRAELYASLAGNAFFARRPGQIRCLRPDWTTIILGSQEDADVAAWDVDADVLGYMYQPGGPHSNREPEFFLADEVAHYAPIPDPEAQYRGMSWLSPVVREVMADKAATEHKLKFFENGATANLVVKSDVNDTAKFQQWVKLMRESSEGLENAYKTLYLGAGADASVVGADFRQMEFKVTQGAGETRIAAAAGVPPIIVGLSEGLQAATYSNYGQARRAFADGTMRPLWREIAGSLARIVDVPPGAELWYDDRDIAFLQDDEKDAAEIMQFKATATKTFVDAGYEPDSVVEAVAADDVTLLKHSGLVSVQLRPPGAPPPLSNGSQPSRAAELVAAFLNQED